MLELFVEAGPQSGQRFALAASTVLGRGQFADLVIADLAVSRRHAQIEPEGAAWLLRDLESANGTRHNGKVLLAPVRLDDGDAVELGQTRLRVRMPDRGETTSAPPPAPPAVVAVSLPEATMMEADVSLPAPRGVYETSPPGELKAFVPGVERRQQVVQRLQFFQRMAELMAIAGVMQHQMRDALAALAEVFPLCRRLVLMVRDTPHRPWRVLAQRVSAGDELDLGIAQALANAAQGANRVVIAGSDAAPAPVAAALMPRMPAAAAVILSNAGTQLGVLYLDAQDDAEALSTRDADFLLSCAGQFGALLAAYRHAESGRLVHAEEFELTRRIQRRFLPTATPRFDGYEIADSYSAARIVGGDLFDFLTLADGRPLFFIGDVSGKGFPAALLMARIGAQLRAVAVRARNAAEVLRLLDTQMRPELESGMFMTAVAAVLDVARGGVDIASAGHPMPLLRRADGVVDTLPVVAAPALGVGGGNFYESRIDLARGDGLLFYTDGLDEARNADDEAFGLGRVHALLAAARSAGQAIEALTSAVEAYYGDLEPFDDLALIALWRR
ncbi:MAG: SpoIIE family protein phosphatase [Xanthomonadales bacterium]|nr:SpoIIE family protein phosphatase [Xanthomonadales bacterium]